jgi:hypothetical protein
VPVFAGLIKSNIIHLVGLIVYGLILIGLTALGYKIIASVVGFKAAEASEKQSLFMGIVTLGLIISFGLIIAITSYQSSPEVVLAPEANIVGAGGSCGSRRESKSCGSKKKRKPCCRAAVSQPVSQSTPQAESPAPMAGETSP